MQRNSFTTHMFLVLILLALSSCATMHLNDPQLDILDIKPRSGQGLKFGFDISLKISNPNNIALPVAGISYTAKINNAPLIQGVSSDLPTIPAYGSVVVNLSSDVSLLSAPRLILELMDNKKKQLTYTLTTNIDLKGLLPSFELEKSGELPTNY